MRKNCSCGEVEWNRKKTGRGELAVELNSQVMKIKIIVSIIAL